ncbi:hypothetical protein [Streptomyces sp. NBRC 109706]|uniref:hypothetical protein n=1 Tax=Streptomyces sp. NBRC 109706 TaxID=1550035 RepID=UPI00099C09D1|nr:hypothetical protein [Streptomyces sp. NBRC 109706]
MTTTIPTASTPTNPPEPPRATTELSRHNTSEGTVRWSRCACGRLRMTLTPKAPTTPSNPSTPEIPNTPETPRPALTAGTPTPGCPLCG